MDLRIHSKYYLQKWPHSLTLRVNFVGLNYPSLKHKSEINKSSAATSQSLTIMVHWVGNAMMFGLGSKWLSVTFNRDALSVHWFITFVWWNPLLDINNRLKGLQISFRCSRLFGSLPLSLPISGMSKNMWRERWHWVWKSKGQHGFR